MKTSRIVAGLLFAGFVAGCGPIHEYEYQMSQGISYPIFNKKYHDLLGVKLVCKVPVQVIKNSDDNLTYAIPVYDAGNYLRQVIFDNSHRLITTLPENSVFTVVHVTRRYDLDRRYYGQPLSGADVIIAHVDSPNYHKDVVIKVLVGEEKGNLSDWYDQAAYEEQ